MTDFKAIVIGPGFDIRATILCAKMNKAIIVMNDKPDHRNVVIPDLHIKPKLVELPIKAPLTVEALPIFQQDESKHWSKKNRHNRKF